jgi:hypothetical protein
MTGLSTTESLDVELCEYLIESGSCILDIGLYTDHSSKLFARLTGPTGQVHAFEVRQDQRTALDPNVENDLRQRVVTIPPSAGGADLDAVALLLHASDDIHPLQSAAHHNTVKCVQIEPNDGLNVDSIDFLRIAAEGYEFQILSRLRDALLRSPNLIICMEFRAVSMLETGIQPKTLIQFLVG